MATYVGAKIGALIPYIDERLSNYMAFTTNCDIPSELHILFNNCIKAVAMQMEKESFFEQGRYIQNPVACVITDSDKITIKLDDNQCGMYTTLIIYPIHKWINFNQIKQSVCIVEEMCHVFWHIHSEFEVNFKVFDVLKNLYPNITMADLYNQDNMSHLAALEGKTYP